MTSLKDALITGSLLLVAVIAGTWSGHLGWCLFAATLIWIGIQYNQYRKVMSWSRRPLTRPQNGSDPWFALAYRPYRALQRQRQRTRAIGNRMRQLLGLAEVMPDGVIILNGNGDIEGINQAAKQLLHLKDSDVGLGLSTIIRVPDFIAFVRSEEPSDAPLEFTSPFDADTTYEARRVAMEDGRAVVIVRDITALNRLLTMRQNFIANVSHELRTPITVVNGYLETITDDTQPDDMRLHLTGKLQKPMKRMRSLVDDLLLLSQLESTPVEQHEATLPVRRVIASAVAEVQGLTQREDQIKIACTDTFNVLGNETELHSVCVNLLSNALRYTPDDAEVEIGCQQHDDRVRIYVRDHGIGIAPEHLHHITERFYRVDMAGSRSSGGTGLGLAIVKHILRRHHSVLQVESHLGSGSLFYFDLQIAADLYDSAPSLNQANS